MAVDTPQNPLISTQKTSDSGLQVALHPLVLLTISDYITRHTLRQQKGPLVGALLGEQNGREITIEHAFDCQMVEVEGQIVLHQAAFEERLQQMKDVHKVPALDLVGWYTIMPVSGPQPTHLPVHQQILGNFNESAILLGFHPTAVLDGAVGGKLPLTIYESNYEAEGATADAGEDKEMKDGEPQLSLRFKELPYTVETGEAEMISVDFVARGGGNATAVDGTLKKESSEDTKGKGKGKTRAAKKEDHEGEGVKADDHILSREDDELIASLTAKANAIKMLRTRVNLIATYLRNLPPSYVSSDSPEIKKEADDEEYTPVNHSVLRSIQALLTRLSLLIPADSVTFEHQLLSEQNDVNLVSLLSDITTSIKEVRSIGKKSQIVEGGKSSRGKGVLNLIPGSDAWVGNSILGAGDLMS